jgi:phage protein D
MPAIKKKGALFAIYTDSPAATKPTSSKVKAPAPSPTKLSSATREKRKALTSVQTTVPAKRAASAQDANCKLKTKLVVLMDKPSSTPVTAPRKSKVADKENVQPVHNTRSTSRSPVKTMRTAAQAQSVVKSIKKGTLVAKTVPGLKGGKRYEVEWDADPVLGDVSAVYGADPSGEPEGFREVVSDPLVETMDADNRPYRSEDQAGDLQSHPPTPR